MGRLQWRIQGGPNRPRPPPPLFSADLSFFGRFLLFSGAASRNLDSRPPPPPPFHSSWIRHWTIIHSVKENNLWRNTLYAVKVQTSLAPLSWFPGSRVPTAHVHQCCTWVMRRLCRRKWNWQRNWQSVNQYSWDPWQWTTWSRRVTSDFNSVLMRKGMTF